MEEIGDALDIEFTKEDGDNFDTLNGFLISKLNRIPQEDEEFEMEFEGYRFQVLSVENKMIRTVRAVRLERPAEDSGFEEVKKED